MEIPRKTDYALRMLADLVRNPDGVVSVRTAARDNDIPYPLRAPSSTTSRWPAIVTNSRGAAGGMRLAVDPARTTLLELIEAVQGPGVRGRLRGGRGPGVPSPRVLLLQPGVVHRRAPAALALLDRDAAPARGGGPLAGVRGQLRLVATKGARALALGADGEPLLASASGMAPDADDAAAPDAVAGEKDDAAPDAAGAARA